MSNDVNLIVNFRCSLATLMGLQQQQKRQTLQVLVVLKTSMRPQIPTKTLLKSISKFIELYWPRISACSTAIILILIFSLFTCAKYINNFHHIISIPKEREYKKV